MDARLDKLTLSPRVVLALAKRLRTAPPHDGRVRELQLRKLKRVLVHAFDTFPFYRDRMGSVGFDPRDLRDLEELQALPALDRNGYREFTTSLCRREPERYARYFQDYTSGSTAEPLTVYRSWPERAILIARWLRVLVSNGYRPHHRAFAVVSPDRLRRGDSLIHGLGVGRRAVAPFDLPAEDLVAAYVAARPDVFYTTKTIMVKMATHIREARIQVQRPRLYVTLAETMDPNSMETIEAVFGSDNRVASYGSVEFGSMAYDRPGRHEKMYFCHDTHVLELEDEGVANDTFGRSIITDLDVFSMPIIRYNLGDWIRCDVEDGVKVITEIQGRQDDWVVFPDGSRCSYHPFKVALQKHPEVRQYRVLQHTLHDIEILAVVDGVRDHAALRRELLAALERGVRAGVNWSVRFVDRIPPDPNAKLRMIVSKVASGGE